MGPLCRLLDIRETDGHRSGSTPRVPTAGPVVRREEVEMEITKDTKVSEILQEYGDIAEVMEVFGVKRVAGYNIRKFITKALTVEWAARVHRVPLDDFLVTLRTAVAETPPD